MREQRRIYCFHISVSLQEFLSLKQNIHKIEYLDKYSCIQYFYLGGRHFTEIIN